MPKASCSLAAQGSILQRARANVYANAHGNVKSVLADAVRIFKLGDDLCGTIRDHIPPGEAANFSMAVNGDYDLFVNKLAQSVEDFRSDLRKA